jgi:Tol biopolymer transport system component
MTRHLLRIVASSFVAITSAIAQIPETGPPETGPPDTLEVGQARIWALTSGAWDHSPFYSPDGDTIAFVRGDRGSARIWIKASDGSGMARQITFGEGNFSDWYPDFSPDGRHLCFSSDRDNVDRVWTVSLDGGEPEPLVELHTNMGGVAPTWSPDGMRIAYSAFIEGNMDIYTISVDGGTPQRITTDPMSDRLPSWSPDGETLVYGSDQDSVSIWFIPARGGVPWSIQTGTTRPANPKFSPDGRWILFRAGGRQPHTWIIPVDGGESVSVTTADSLQGWMADWSPDGTHIAYTRGIMGGWGQLVVIPTAGGETRTLTDSIHTFAAGPRWSPDGGRIAFIGLQRDLLVIDVETGRLDTLATIRRHGGLWSPSWSPDGEWLAFASNRLGNINLWLTPAGGGEAEAITLGPGLHVVPVWAPDGETIHFLYDPDGAFSIWSTTVWGDPPVPLLEDPEWRDLPFAVRPEEGDLVIHRAPTSGTSEQEGYWSLPLEGGTPRFLFADMFAGPNSGSGRPSADLGRVVEAEHATGALWMSDPAGAKPRLVLTDNARNPALSPDGQHIAYTRLFSGEVHDIYIADVRQIVGTHVFP